MPAAWSTSATSTTRLCRVARTASSRPMPWRARVSAERDGTMHIAIYVAAAIAAAGAGCAFAQVGDALQRPALSVKAPQRAVLLGAAAGRPAPGRAGQGGRYHAPGAAGRRAPDGRWPGQALHGCGGVGRPAH